MTEKLYYKYWGKAENDALKVAYCSGQDERDKNEILVQFKPQLAKSLKKPENQLQLSDLDEWAKKEDKKIGKERWEYKQPNYAAYHLLPYHCLDVAAVGAVLLEQHPFLADRFEHLFAIPKPILIPWLKLLLALHDSGKFAESFQQLKPELRKKWWGDISKTNYDMRHDSLGFILWEDENAIRKSLQIDRHFYRDSLRIWLQATTGHHGLPPKNKNNSGKISAKTYFKEADISSAAKFSQEAYNLFKLDKEALQGLVAQDDWTVQQEKASWLLAGFTILCDWLGSDSEFFKYHTDTLFLSDYWEKYALPSAKLAVKRSGILPAQPATPKTLQQLFGYLKTPTPLQQQAEQLPLTHKPQLLMGTSIN